VPSPESLLSPIDFLLASTIWAAIWQPFFMARRWFNLTVTENWVQAIFGVMGVQNHVILLAARTATDLEFIVRADLA
jgi:hypothetical protein